MLYDDMSMLVQLLLLLLFLNDLCNNVFNLVFKPTIFAGLWLFSEDWMQFLRIEGVQKTDCWSSGFSSNPSGLKAIHSLHDLLCNFLFQLLWKWKKCCSPFHYCNRRKRMTKKKAKERTTTNFAKKNNTLTCSFDL